MKEFKEHAGGGLEYEWHGGLAHPIVEPEVFGENPPEKLYTMDQMSEALSEVVRWIVHDGSFQQRGIFNRAVVFCYMLDAPGVNEKTQAALAQRLKLSRSQTNALIRDFSTHFEFQSTKQRKMNKKKKKPAKTEENQKLFRGNKRFS